MSDSDSTTFLQQITRLIHQYCQEHAGLQDEESIESAKMIFELIHDSMVELGKSYPRTMAESFSARNAPSKIRDTLEMKRPTTRMIFDTLRMIVLGLYLGTRKLNQEEYEKTPFAKQIPGPLMGYNFRELADAAEILYLERSQLRWAWSE